MKELCIQIVNYKTKKYLLEYLKTLKEDVSSLEVPCTVAIADNNSGDSLSDIPDKYPSLNIDVYHLSKNGGYGAGHNSLAKKYKTSHILISNPDVYYTEKNTVKRLLESMETYNADVLGCRLLTEDGSVQEWDHGALNGVLAHIAIIFGASHWRIQNKPTPVAWANGAHFLITRKWFNRVSGFDENFFLYKEEEDLCLRLRNLGGLVYYDPSISVQHHGSVVSSKDKYFEKSDKYYIKKHYAGTLRRPFTLALKALKRKLKKLIGS